MNIYEYMTELSQTNTRQADKNWRAITKQFGQVSQTTIKQGGKIYLEIRFTKK